MNYVLLSVAVVVFVLTLKYTGLVERVSAAAGVAREAMKVIASPGMTDEEKETAARKAAIGMFTAFFAILARVVVVLGLPLLLVAVVVFLGVVSAQEMEAAATNWYFLIGSTVAMIGLWRLAR